MNRLKLYLFAATILAASGAMSIQAADPISYSLCDVRVLYVYQEPASIDWPTIYYLNDYHGCRVDLLSIYQRAEYSHESFSIPGREILRHSYYLPDFTDHWLGRAFERLFIERRPDIVLFADGHRLHDEIRQYLINLKPSSGKFFNVSRVYQRDDDPIGSNGYPVILHSRELMSRYADRISREAPILIGRHVETDYDPGDLVRYWEIGKESEHSSADRIDFLSGLKSLRLTDMVDRALQDNPSKKATLNQVKKFTKLLKRAIVAPPKERVSLTLEGYRELSRIFRPDLLKGGEDRFDDFSAYLSDRLARAERTAFDVAGIECITEVVRRDSPEGPRLKYRVSLSVDGPLGVDLRKSVFYPYWNDSTVSLDLAQHHVVPHQTFVREYPVSISVNHLEPEKKQQLSFMSEISCNDVPMGVKANLQVQEVPNIKVEFEPDFLIVQPREALSGDRLVSSTGWKVIITKPYDYSGTVGLNLPTSGGIATGVYRTSVDLKKGQSREVIRIPFTFSNQLELGIHQQPVSLTLGKQLIAADTGKLRIAECRISESLRIGFLADESGLLEDVLAMTFAHAEPVTDRSLLLGDLNSYDVLIVGTGSLPKYPNLARIQDRLQSYLSYGGSLVIMPQDESWPPDILPVTFAPTVERVTQNEIVNRIPDANLLSRPYRISPRGLLSGFHRKWEVNSAAIAPAEMVFMTSDRGSLLSVSRLGQGQIIYCGLPLLEMIARLNIDAIHLLANILNY